MTLGLSKDPECWSLARALVKEDDYFHVWVNAAQSKTLAMFFGKNEIWYKKNRFEMTIHRQNPFIFTSRDIKKVYDRLKWE